MKINVKKNMLLILTIINTLICVFNLGNNIITDFSVLGVLFDLFVVFLAFVPCLLMPLYKKFNHLYYLILFYAFFAFLGLDPATYMVSLVSLVLCYVESVEEKGKLEQIIKRHPIYMSCVIILSGISFLMIGSIFEFFSQLTYGSSMLGELFATIFLFFLILVCRKGYLIYKNNGSVVDALVVSLPFFVYSLYLGCSIFVTNLVEGYSLVSLENIITIILLYLFVGIFEDFLTRGLALNILLDKFGKTKKGIWLSILLSSLFFGLIHFVNIFTGASFEGVLIQVISSICIGVYFSAIYLRSGSVWVPALLHGFYDIAVSCSSFFMIKEVVDINGEYGDAISNYSWGNVIVGFLFILLSLFLLRKKKMNVVYKKLNNMDTGNVSKNSFLDYVLIGFALGAGISYCFISSTSMFQVKEYAYNLYDMIPIYSDYQYEYGLIYRDGDYNYDSLSDEVKLIMVMSNLDKIKDAEEKKSSQEIITYIENSEIEKMMKKIFNEDSRFKYVNFKYSYNTSCIYEEEDSRYKCSTINNEVSNNLKVYSNIDKISFSDDALLEACVYYLVYDESTNTLYADSDLKTVYRYNTTIEEISDGVKYKNNDDNREFWQNIKKNNNDKVPTYKISLDLNDSGDGVHFVNSKFVRESIESTEFVDKKIDNNTNRFSSDKYSFNYNNDLFDVNVINNYLVLKHQGKAVLKIDTIAVNKWLDLYKTMDSISVNLGNNTYQNVDNDYLIYKNDFYIISIYTSDVEMRNELLKIVLGLEFE